MQTINLTALNNQDFKLTLDMSAWIAAGYDLSTASKIRLEARKSASDVTVELFLSNQTADQAHGTITLTGQSLVFLVPAAKIQARVPKAASFVYDSRIETADVPARTVDMFGGALMFAQGVSR